MEEKGREVVVMIMTCFVGKCFGLLSLNAFQNI